LEDAQTSEVLNVAFQRLQPRLPKSSLEDAQTSKVLNVAFQRLQPRLPKSYVYVQSTRRALRIERLQLLSVVQAERLLWQL
jgi:hypothetical protein